MAATPAVRHYVKRASVAMAAYAATVAAAAWLGRTLQPDSPLLAVLAILPALPLLGVIAAVGLYLRDERDEYIRMTAVKVLLAATAFMLCLSTIWGFLEAFGSVPHVPAYSAIVVWAVGFLVGNIWWRWPE